MIYLNNRLIWFILLFTLLYRIEFINQEIEFLENKSLKNLKEFLNLLPKPFNFNFKTKNLYRFIINVNPLKKLNSRSDKPCVEKPSKQTYKAIYDLVEHTKVYTFEKDIHKNLKYQEDKSLNIRPKQKELEKFIESSRLIPESAASIDARLLDYINNYINIIYDFNHQLLNFLDNSNSVDILIPSPVIQYSHNLQDLDEIQLFNPCNHLKLAILILAKTTCLACGMYLSNLYTTYKFY